MTSVFQAARDSFLASLNPQDQETLRSCSSATELVARVEAFQAIKRDGLRGKRLFKCIAAFKENVQPYFDVVSTLVSSHPEFTAIGWGATLLVLELASNFATFFETLTKFLERLALQLPSYEDVLNIPSVSFSDRLKGSISAVYTNLFHFFNSVTRVFNRANGKSRPRAFVVGGLLWKPFDVRFKDVVEQFQFHQKVVVHELQITELKTLGKLVQVQEKELDFSKEERKRVETVKWFTDLDEGTKQEQERKFRDEKLRQLKEWISPPDFARALEDAQDAREDGTASWLFEEPQYTAWAAWWGGLGSSGTCFGENALWICGNPGCGKTILAAATVEELEHRCSLDSQPSPQVCYFFFDSRRADSQFNYDAQRAILSQILHSRQKEHDLIDKFVFAMEHTIYGQSTATRHEIHDLLRIVLAANDPVSIVIDGIDECADPEAMVQGFLLFAGNPVVKTIFFGRPAGPSVLDMVHCMPIKQQLNIGKSTSADIRCYLTNKIESLKGGRLISPHAGTKSLVDRLVRGADGMFLWAQLMILHLRSPAFNSVQRIRIIDEVTSPEKLADMYKRILDKISSGLEAEQILTREILMWLILSKRPLTSLELKHVVQSSACTEVDEDFENFNNTVITLCAGLVELNSLQRLVPSKATFRLTHLTVTEYCLPLIDESQESGFWPFPIRNLRRRRMLCEIKVAAETLRFLTYTLPSQPLGGRLGSEASKHDLDEAFPFCSYAASFWIDHVLSTAATQGSSSTAAEETTVQPGDYKPLLTSLPKFMSQKLLLMAWIEASYVCSRPPEYMKLRHWATWASEHLRLVNSIDLGQIAKDLQEFSADLESLYQDWNSYLSKSPGLIWKEVTAFTPSRFLVQTSAVTVSPLAKDSSGSQQLSAKAISSRYLCKVSEVNFGERFVAIVSVWPSSAFEEFLQQNDYLGIRSHLRDLCSGWHARYEIWSIESSPNRLLDLKIPLKNGSVWLQMQHSGHQPVNSRWRVQFPITIAPTGRTFAILQHIYILKSAIKDTDVKLYTFPLPLDSISTVQNKWSPNYTPSDSVTRDLYLYQLSFSRDGHFISFIDEVGMINNMAVYEVKSSEEFSVGLVNHLKTKRITILDTLCDKVSFHPELRLLAISTGGGAYLWEFGNENLGLPYSSYTEISPELIRVQRCQDNQSSDKRQIEKARDIEFSSGGEMIVMRIDGHPEIWPIPNFIIQRANYQSNTTRRSPAPVGRTPHEAHNANTSPSRLSEYKGSSTGIISPGYTSFGSTSDHNSRRFATTSTSQGAVFLRLWSSSSDGNPDNNNGSSTTNTELQLNRESAATLELTRLPNWPGMHTTAASVIWPQSCDDLIRIVLNKSPQPWYTFHGKVDQKLPIVIDQDQRLVKGAAVSTVENGLTCARRVLGMGDVATERC